MDLLDRAASQRHRAVSEHRLNWAAEGRDWPNRGASDFVRAAGLRWHVQRQGAGPVCLLIHGTGAATHSWRALLPRLAAHFDVVAPDLPGHGFTDLPRAERLSLPGMASQLGELLRHMDCRPELAVGHSAGAAILIRMCLDQQLNLKLLVSLNGALLPSGGSRAPLLGPITQRVVGADWLPRMMAWRAGRQAFIDGLLQQTGSRIEPRDQALYTRLARSPRHVAAALRMMAHWDTRPLARALPTLDTRLLLVAGDRDRMIPARRAAQVAAIVPDARVSRLDGLGHLAHEEQPDRVADLVLREARLAGLLEA